MLKNDGIIGVLLLILCGVVAVIMITAIVTGKQPTVPDAARIPILVLGIGGMLIMLWQRFGNRFRR